MKNIKKLSTYLLENKPLLWHTRFIQLTTIGVLLWIMSYIIGFLTTTTNVLRLNTLSYYYGSSSYVYYHIGAVIVIIAVWAIFYFKNNAFKSFYPISRFYFHKILGLLFIPFFLYVSAPIPFDAGARAKARTILSHDQLKKDAETINLVTPFLYLENSSYEIESKAFPSPFPLKSISYNTDDGDWGYRYNNNNLIVIDSSLMAISEYPYKSYEIDEKNTTYIDDKKYQFYTTKDVQYDNCTTKNVINKFYVFDSLEAAKLSRYSIKNYSRVVISDNLFITNSKQDEKEEVNRNNRLIQSAPFDVFYRDDRNNNDSKFIFTENYGAEIVRIADEEDFDRIDKLLVDFLDVLRRYKVPHNLNKNYIKLVLQTRAFNEFSSFIDESHRIDSEKYYSPEPIKRSFSDKQKGETGTVEDDLSPGYQYFEKHELSEIFRNYSYSKTTSVWDSSWLFYSFFALAIVFVFLFFEIVKPIPFIISLPAWGVLFIFYGLISVSIGRNIGFSGVMFGLLFLLIIVQVLNLFFLTNKTVSKKIVNIGYTMALVSAPFILGLFLVWFTETTSYEVFNECSDYGTTIYLFDGLLTSPFVFWLSGLVGICLVLFLPRAWKSREE